MTIRSFSIATSVAIIALCGCSGSTTSDTANSGGTNSGGTNSGGTSSGGTSSGGNPPASGAPVPGSMLGSALASAYCPPIATCCTSMGIASDVATCTTTLGALVDAEIKLNLDNPKIAYDAAAARRCVEAYRAASSACTDRALSHQVNQACQKVFMGTVPPGGGCASSAECVPPAAGYVSCDTAVCVVQTDSFGTSSVHAKVGEPCSGTCSGDENSSSCSGTASTGAPAAGSCWVEDGLFCGTDNTCQAAPKIGQPCGNYNYCEAAGFCQGAVCAADTATGECTYGEGCLPTSYCDTTTASPFHCAPRKANGEACNDDSECVGGQCEQDHCRNFSVATLASCAGIFGD